MVIVLFPGRHHMLTKFQHQYLKNLINDGAYGKKVDKIIFAVTSANHENTRRNPVPLYLRSMMISKFTQDFPCETKIYPIPDAPKSEKFADYILSQIFYQSGEKLTPENTILACSTPEVISLFKKKGFSNLLVELIEGKNEKYSDLRPFEIIDLLVKSGKNWRHDGAWKVKAAEATQDIYLEYNLGDLIQELFSDSLLNEDADITETRDYNTYAVGMDKNMKFKFEDIKPFVVEGKIVDAGCGTGALINLLSKEFSESDIIGIEATRKFYEYCKMQDYGNAFVFFYRRNITDQNFKENMINTFIYSSVLHEIYSYIGEKTLIKVLKNTFDQLTTGGRIIIRDVIGPENPKKMILLELNQKDGKESGDIKELSTYQKFFRFAKDFIPRKIHFEKILVDNKDLIQLTIQDAYEYLSKMTYVDNWQSEMHEEFGFWSFPDWKKELGKIGFKIVEGSKTFQSQHIIEKMYKPRATLYELKNKNLVQVDYPQTNIILAGEK
jgi:SAM-dependent methyltransferase